MKYLKYLLLKRFNQIFLLSTSMTLAVVLLMLRMKVHQEYFFLFLVWNLFLAVIPYAITTILAARKSHNKLMLLLSFVAWLAFLPNAPYIVTDLVHLKLSETRWIWLDILVVSSFAFNGMALYLISLRDMSHILKAQVSKNIMSYFVPVITLLTGFGIYLGRVLRYNSWEIIQNPFALCKDVFNILLYPSQNTSAWMFTIAFSIFLYVIYLFFTKTPELDEINNF